MKGYACAECSTMTQIRNLREKNQDFVFGEFKRELIEMLKALGLPIIKVLDENEMKHISSLVQQICFSEFGEDIDDAFNLTIKTVSPARKAFLLCEEFQKNKPRTSRMSRHLYDLDKLSHTEYMAKALDDGELYLEIVRHREKFYHPSYVDYSKELPDVIDFLPPLTVEEAFRTDYDEMRGSFIYEEAPLSFDELLRSIASIQERFRKCKTAK